MGWGGREAHEGGGICIYMAESCCCTAIILQLKNKEYSCYRRWRHTEVVHKEACTLESQPHSSALTVLSGLQLSHG